MKLKHTRAIIDAIHSGELAGADCSATPIFGLQVGDAVQDASAQQRQQQRDASFSRALVHLVALLDSGLQPSGATWSRLPVWLAMPH